MRHKIVQVLSKKFESEVFNKQIIKILYDNQKMINIYKEALKISKPLDNLNTHSIKQ